MVTKLINHIIQTVHSTVCFFILFKMSNDPLHGKTLQAIVEDLVKFFGWEALSKEIPIKCFSNNPSVKSSLTFLRKTPWAREQKWNNYI